MNADIRRTMVKQPYSHVRWRRWSLAVLISVMAFLPVAILTAQPQPEAPPPRGQEPPSVNGCEHPEYWVHDGTGKVQWGDMTIVYAAKDKSRILARIPMKPVVVKKGISGVYLVLGNFQVCSKTNGTAKPVGNFKNDPLVITVTYGKELLWRLGGKPPKYPRLYFWDNVHGVWHSVGSGEEIKPGANNQKLSVIAEKANEERFTVKVLSWPADDVCLIFGG